IVAYEHRASRSSVHSAIGILNWAAMSPHINELVLRTIAFGYRNGRQSPTVSREACARRTFVRIPLLNARTDSNWLVTGPGAAVNRHGEYGVIVIAITVVAIFLVHHPFLLNWHLKSVARSPAAADVKRRKTETQIAAK